MREQTFSYTLFVDRVQTLGVERLVKENLAFWAAFLRALGVSETQFLRRDDSSFWLSLPGMSQRELMQHLVDPTSKIRDAGSISITGENEFDVRIYDGANPNDTERVYTLMILSRLLGDEARMVGLGRTD